MIVEPLAEPQLNKMTISSLTAAFPLALLQHGGYFPFVLPARSWAAVVTFLPTSTATFVTAVFTGRDAISPAEPRAVWASPQPESCRAGPAGRAESVSVSLSVKVYLLGSTALKHTAFSYMAPPNLE